MADILIRNMKMPRDCFECPFYRFGDVRDRVTSCWIKTEKGEKCPLVPLPEGHGRLGDLEELETTVIDAIEEGFNAADVLLDIRFAPTIVPAEGGGEDG